MKRLYLFSILLATFLVSCEDNAFDSSNETSTDTETTPPPQESFAQAMLQGVNAMREGGNSCAGPVDTLVWNAQLAEAAERHAQDMFDNQLFEHEGSDGSTVGERVTEASYSWLAVAENIALGYNSIDAALEGWEESPGHCENLMSSDYTEMGAARVGDYWVQVFARPQ